MGVSPIPHTIMLPPTNSHKQLHSFSQLQPQGLGLEEKDSIDHRDTAAFLKKAPNSLTLQGNGVHAPPLESG